VIEGLLQAVVGGAADEIMVAIREAARDEYL
jgi:hypothetical protein